MQDLYGHVSESEKLKMAMNLPLDEKMKQATAVLQEYTPMALSLNPRGYSVGDSGGKDSVVTKWIMSIAKVPHFTYYSNTTMDPPELIYFLKEHHPDTQWIHNGLNLTRYMVKHGKGMPTRLGRWCCSIYKEQSFKNTFRCLGVRAAESPRREKQWRQVAIHSVNKLPYINPLLYFTDRDIWEIINGENLPVCSLYKEQGIHRIGCVGCPLAGTKVMLREFERWPSYQQLWMKGCQDFFNAWKDVPTLKGNDRAIKEFKTWTNYWDWWLSKGVNDVREDNCHFKMF
jgi:phosphoadenosine phosphosulfate reductase